MRFVIKCLPLLLAAQAWAGFVATSLGNNNVYLLDDDMNLVSSWSTGLASANGVAVNGSTIYVGQFGSASVEIYNTSGVLLNSFSLGSPGASYLQGLAYVNGELAAANESEIRFFSATDGSYIRSIGGINGTTEALTFDGTNILALDDQILVVDPATGTVNTTLPNAGIGFAFGGTGLAILPGGGYMIGGPDGAWVKTDALGAVTASGNNGVDMYGLEYINLGASPVPEPSTVVFGLVGIAALGLRWKRS